MSQDLLVKGEMLVVNYQLVSAHAATSLTANKPDGLLRFDSSFFQYRCKSFSVSRLAL
jgi:hypothetical protein